MNLGLPPRLGLDLQSKVELDILILSFVTILIHTIVFLLLILCFKIDSSIFIHMYEGDYPYMRPPDTLHLGNL